MQCAYGTPQGFISATASIKHYEQRNDPQDPPFKDPQTAIDSLLHDLDNVLAYIWDDRVPLDRKCELYATLNYELDLHDQRDRYLRQRIRLIMQWLEVASLPPNRRSQLHYKLASLLEDQQQSWDAFGSPREHREAGRELGSEVLVLGEHTAVEFVRR